MAVVNITRGQYRTFAEIAKANSCVLSLSTVEEMKCFGEFSFMAIGVVRDAADGHSGLIEKAPITLARSIDADQFRSASRPEIDWGQLEDHEIFPFLFWHEIGHRVDNFDAFSVRLRSISWAIPNNGNDHMCGGYDGGFFDATDITC